MLTGEDRPGWVEMDHCYSSRLLHLDLFCRKSVWELQPQRELGGGGEGERRKKEGLLWQH